MTGERATREDFLDEDGQWECVRCSACCVDVSVIMPQLALVDGSCKYLIMDFKNDDSYCAIFENRPEVCRFKKQGVTNNQLADFCAASLNNLIGDN